MDGNPSFAGIATIHLRMKKRIGWAACSTRLGLNEVVGDALAHAMKTMIRQQKKLISIRLPKVENITIFEVDLLT